MSVCVNIDCVLLTEAERRWRRRSPTPTHTARPLTAVMPIRHPPHSHTPTWVVKPLKTLCIVWNIILCMSRPEYRVIIFMTHAHYALYNNAPPQTAFWLKLCAYNYCHLRFSYHLCELLSIFYLLYIHVLFLLLFCLFLSFNFAYLRHAWFALPFFLSKILYLFKQDDVHVHYDSIADLSIYFVLPNLFPLWL